MPHLGTEFIGVDGELDREFNRPTRQCAPFGTLFMFVQPVLGRTLRHGLDHLRAVEVHLTQEVVGTAGKFGSA